MGCSCNQCCNGGGLGNCSCGQLVSPPSPYYNQAGQVQETHCQSVIQEIFATAVASATDFAIPLCNGIAVARFPGVTQVQVGSYFWSTAAGYLKVVDFDYRTSEVTLLNECILGTAAPGTIIPRCTLFNIVDAPFQYSNAQTWNPTITLDAGIPVVTGKNFHYSTNFTGGLLLWTGIFDITIGAVNANSILVTSPLPITQSGGGGGDAYIIALGLDSGIGLVWRRWGTSQGFRVKAADHSAFVAGTTYRMSIGGVAL